ncbi:unnamed protein product [Symbiodinium necroappetens]|uniref:Uncharacterized protein n=1 Tax=Symbiodinium necroappetens TaxID=1628268 RepID=A0A812RIC0_9DINO|nr:unnamed protein product [Symbiodinium necroappetens]
MASPRELPSASANAVAMRERTRSRLHRLDTTSSEALGPPKEDDAATPHSVFGRTPIQPDLLNSDWQTQSSCRGIQYALLLCLLKLTAQIPNPNSSQILGHMIRPGPVPADRNSCGCCGAVSAPEVIAEGTRTEQQILRTQGVADTDEALAQRTLQRVLAEKREQDELFDMWRTEVKEARDELHEQIRTSIRKDLAEARENQLHQEIQFQSNAVRRLHEETLKQQHELDTVRDTLQRRHQAAIENYKFSFEIVQEELAECVKERDEYAQELQVHKEANEELKCEVEALEDELESFGRFQAIEAEQQQRLRTLLATSDRDRLVTFFDIWKRYTHGEWESWTQLPKASAFFMLGSLLLHLLASIHGCSWPMEYAWEA